MEIEIRVALLHVPRFPTDYVTGESLPVRKDPNATFADDTGPGDRLNVAYSSSTVTKGRARGIVFATGLDTEIGTIAAALRETGSKVRLVKRNDQGKAGPHRYAQAWSLTTTDAVGRFLGVNVGTPLQKKFSRLAVLLFCVAVVCAIIVLAANGFSSEQEVIIYAVATGLSMIPASLIVVLTITMAAGTKRMVERNVVVRNLKSLEALGAVTDICSDKTGTLTQGKMITKKAYVPACGTFSVEDANEPFNPTDGSIKLSKVNSDNNDGEKPGAPMDTTSAKLDSNLSSFLDVAAFANISTVWQGAEDGAWHARGDPTEIAINVFAARFGWSRTQLIGTENPAWKTLVEFPFDGVECDLTFRGLIGLYDPPRTESAASVKECRQAGIEVHMLTGDHPGTARAIAIDVGILPSLEKLGALPKDVADALVMTAGEFDKFSDDQIDKLPQLPLVVARCAPNTEVRMIEALHRRTRFAAMTGDGVNDSPSLKRADVGIAMGQAGSDVAKDASDIVLTDDNFASIIKAIEEGRRMFDNIQKFILHLLAENIAQACTLLIGLAFKDARNLSVFPLAPVEILWVIMITSGMPDMGLGFEVATPDITKRPPQSLKRGVFTLEVMVDMLVYGLWIAALCLGNFSLVLFGFGDGNLGVGCNDSYSEECDTVFRARATCFACLTWFALFPAWELVDMRRSFFRMQPGSKKYFTQWIYDVRRNKFLFWAIIFGFITIFPTLYIPVINRVVFKHEMITWEWAVVVVATILFFGGIEAWKSAKRVFFRRHAAINGGSRTLGLGWERENTNESSDAEKGEVADREEQ
ncbi:hypothetical protein MBLNU13_g11303t2 [Cladosporium sp. NU13]